MQLVLPTSDQQRLQLLADCLHNLRAPNSPITQLDPALFDDLDQHHASFQATYQQILRAREASRAALSQVKISERQLCHAIRDAYQLVQRQRRNPDFPVHLFEAFGLKRDGTQTNTIHRLRTPIPIAHQLIVADQLATSKGFSILVSPTAAQLQALSDGLNSAQQVLVHQRNQVKQVLEDLRRERKAAALLLQRLRITVQLQLIHLTPQQRQAYLSDLGFQFREKRDASEASSEPQIEAVAETNLTFSDPQASTDASPQASREVNAQRTSASVQPQPHSAEFVSEPWLRAPQPNDLANHRLYGDLGYREEHQAYLASLF